MAEVSYIVPFVIKWETGIVQKPNESLCDLFERARVKGYANDPLDRGGETQTGLTLNAYKAWCLKKNISAPTVTNLKNIPFATWLKILKENFWDKVGGDYIISQGVANILFDFAWASGDKTAVRKVQALVGTMQDGIVGPKTIAAINSKDPFALFCDIKNVRICFCNAIVRNNPSQKKWLKGWVNRINDIKFV